MGTNGNLGPIKLFVTGLKFGRNNGGKLDLRKIGGWGLWGSLVRAGVTIAGRVSKGGFLSSINCIFSTWVVIFSWISCGKNDFLSKISPFLFSNRVRSSLAAIWDSRSPKLVAV